MTKNKKEKFLLFFIFIFSLIIRLYKLDTIPYSVYIDEAGLWYNVQCLLNCGTDQSNNSWPILFTNLYWSQSSMYTYLAFICCNIFGDTLFAIRLPAVFNFILLFIFGNKIVKKLYDKNHINVIFSLLISVCPYFILSSRMALDCNLMLGFSTMFLWFFLKAIDSGKIADAVIAGISCGLVLWTYAVSYITMPIFLIISVIYLIIHEKITWKQLIAFMIPVIILALPLIIVQIINFFDLPELIIGNITFPKFSNNRTNSLNISFNIIATIIAILGVPQRLYECIFLYGNFQWIVMPFLIIGLVFNMKTYFKEHAFSLKKLIYIFFIVGFMTISCLSVEVTTWHINSLMFIAVLFIIDGLYTIKNNKQCLAIIMSIFLICSVSFFQHYYFGNYSQNESESYLVYDSFDNVLKEVNNINTKNKDVYILMPSVIYRVEHDISPIEYPMIYNDIYEDIIWIDSYCFDVGATSLDNPSSNNIYIVEKYYETRIQKLKQFQFNALPIDNYIIFYKDVD